MKIQHVPAAVLLIATCTATAQSNCRYVTVTATNGVTTNTIQLQQGETGELITAWPYAYVNGYQSIVNVTKDGTQFPAFPAGIYTYMPACVVSGPAQFVFNNFAAGSPSLMTVKITPVAYDVNKTLILPPGTNQVYVTMQSSTNLVNWVTATNGVYGSPTTAQFFRISMTSPSQ